MATPGFQPLRQGPGSPPSSVKQLIEGIQLHSSPPSQSSAPTAYSLILSDVRQGGGGGGGGLSGARGNTERSSQLLPLRQTILCNSTFNDDNDVGEIVDNENGGVMEAGHWVASNILMRAKCNEVDSPVQSDVVGEELLQSQHYYVEGTVAMDLVGRRPPRSVCSQVPCPEPAEAPKYVGFWSAFRQQLEQQLRFYKEVALRKWWVLAVPLLLSLLLVALGVFGVVYASTRTTQQQRDYVKGALASTAISTVAGQLEIATFAVMTLSAYLTQRPNCTELDDSYNRLADVISQWDAKNAVYQLQAMPAAVVKYIYPYPDADLARKLIGRDILELSQYRNDTIKQIQARGQRLLLGPYHLVEGFDAMFVTYAVFLPASDPLYDWGCGVQPYDCPPDTCWLPDEANPGGYLKLWGMATSLVRLDALKEGFGFQTYEEQGYHFRLRQLHDNINREAVIDGTTKPPREPVTLTLQKYNLQWIFEVAPAAGWVPAWRDPCIAAVLVGSVMVSSLVLWLLLTREKHNLLLRAMLPRKVIRQLQRGEQTVVEEYHDPVTILFTDIVSYTEVASQLTPLQVVRLLNDLYTEFDALTDKHGVYKVETIGDAFMCVSGCPLREDPVKAAVRMAGMAQDMLALVERFLIRVGDEEMKVKIRIGLHSGPVVAGVIGQRMPRYCLFGDTVNTASRMESNSAPMCINVSYATADLLRTGGAAVVPYMGNHVTPLLSPLRQLISNAPSPARSMPECFSQGTGHPYGAHLGQRRQPAEAATVPSPSPPSPSYPPPTSQPPPLPPLLQLQKLSEPGKPDYSGVYGHGDAGSICVNISGFGEGNFGGGGGSLHVASGLPVGPTLVLHSRGTIHVKGKGPMVCYWLGKPPLDSLG